MQERHYSSISYGVLSFLHSPINMYFLHLLIYISLCNQYQIIMFE